MTYIGFSILLVFSLFPILWFYPLALQHGFEAIFSQYIGVVALILMGISQLFATRLRFLETLFGSLDKQYILHKWLGIMTLAFVFLHENIDAEVKGLGSNAQLNDLAESLGEWSFNGLIFLVILSIAMIIPYHLWKKSHKFIGAFFTLGAIHYFLIQKPFENFEPLGLYVGLFCIMGILSYLYTLIPYGMVQGNAAYKIKSLKDTGGATAVTLTPTSKKIKHQAGQFAFIQFQNDPKKEIHPFTISSAPNDDGTLRFSIKALGDFTHKLTSFIKLDGEVKVSYAYGHFIQSRAKKSNIWVAGGIGITPFVSWAQDLKELAEPVYLFYCVKNQDLAPHLEEIQKISDHFDNFHLHLIESNKNSRLDMDIILQKSQLSPKNMNIAFCGPKAMRKILYNQYRQNGGRISRFRFEEFEMRSGIGLTRLIKWLFNKAQPILTALYKKVSS